MIIRSVSIWKSLVLVHNDRYLTNDDNVVSAQIDQERYQNGSFSSALTPLSWAGIVAGGVIICAGAGAGAYYLVRRRQRRRRRQREEPEINCHLCETSVPTSEWATHRSVCADENKAMLAAIPAASRYLYCPFCHRRLRRWPPDLGPDTFKCHSRGCPVVGRRLRCSGIGVDGGIDGAVRFSCFRCGYDACEACARRKEKTARKEEKKRRKTDVNVKSPPLDPSDSPPGAKIPTPFYYPGFEREVALPDEVLPSYEEATRNSI